ncbi:hypothetical protein ACMDB5_13450 [Flavobacterium sp. W1B]|uniref:hypothetical protein n=1 Tax=Flavobacterium sp. W1B TaxID=3394146 RepID=UPI0039BCA80E
MKTTSNISMIIMLLVFQLCIAQQTDENKISIEKNKSILMEAGVNVSLPVHIQMYRTHRYAIGVNFRAFKKISPKTEIGIKVDYDYRFARNLPDTSNSVKERASHRNFSIIAIKPNVQFNFKHDWFLGAETGVGYAISDENNSIGLGFVSEYNGNAQFGSCSGLYIGKYLPICHGHKNLGITLNLTNFLRKGHAENTLGLKFNYAFNK